MAEARPAEMDSKWDATIDLTVRRVVYGTLAGGVAALFLLRAPTARATVLGFGAGFGAGTAYQQTQGLFVDVIKGPQKS